MNKNEFLNELDVKLRALPEEDRKERLQFYEEMIEDRLAEGKSEEEAINELGGIDKVINDIVEETPLINLVKEKAKPKRNLRAWEILLLILGSPLWIPLLVVVLVLCLLAYLLIWIGVIVVYSIEVGFAALGFGGIVIFLIYLVNGQFSLMYLGLFLLGVGATCLFIFACIGVSKATIKLTKVISRKIKRSFITKGEAK